MSSSDEDFDPQISDEYSLEVQSDGLVLGLFSVRNARQHKENT